MVGGVEIWELSVQEVPVLSRANLQNGESMQLSPHKRPALTLEQHYIPQGTRTTPKKNS